MIVEGLGEDEHIHSFNSIFPSAQLNTRGDTASATEPPAVPFLLLPVAGCPQDPQDRNTNPLLHSLPTPEVITSGSPSSLSGRQLPLLGSRCLGWGWGADSSGTGAAVGSTCGGLLLLVQNYQSDYGGM